MPVVQMPATFENGEVKLTGGSVSDKAHQLCKTAGVVFEAAGSSLEKEVEVTVCLHSTIEPCLEELE